MKESMSITSATVVAMTVITIVCMIAIVGCDSTRHDNTHTIKGKVVLINDSDDTSFDTENFSGVIIELYELSITDAVLSDVIKEYPHIGAHGAQHTMFDHRNEEAKKTTVSDQNGDYVFNDVPKGYYNIVLHKEGWGVRYHYNVSIGYRSEGNEFINETTYLYPEIVMNGIIQDGFHFLANHCYKVLSDLSIYGNVIIENGTRILIAPGTNLNIYGNLETNRVDESLYSVITTGNQTGETIDYFHEIRVVGDISISHLCIDSTTGGFRSENGKNVIDNCIIWNSYAGFLFMDCPYVNISNCIAYKIMDDIPQIYTSHAGFYSLRCDEVLMEKLIMIGNSSGVKIKDYCHGQVSDSFFSHNYYGCEVYSSQVNIHHNHFIGSEKYDIRLCGDQLNPTVEYNELNSTNGIIVGLDSNTNYVDCNPVISNNNLLSSSIALKMIYFNRLDPEATNNYFGTLNETEILKKIFDGRNYSLDGDTSGLFPTTGRFAYIPFKIKQIKGVGIR